MCFTIIMNYSLNFSLIIQILFPMSVIWMLPNYILCNDQGDASKILWEKNFSLNGDHPHWYTSTEALTLSTMRNEYRVQTEDLPQIFHIVYLMDSFASLSWVYITEKYKKNSNFLTKIHLFDRKTILTFSFQNQTFALN